tara:strand:- start:1648 stop:2985 length:1338 start_codon:yes stop_codon:yes gene_type:complete
MLKKIILKTGYFLIIFITSFLLISENILDVNPLIYSNKFDERDAYIYSGVRFSIDEGIFSNGGFSSGFLPNDLIINDQSVENNYYLVLEEVNKSYLDTDITKEALLEKNSIDIFSKEPVFYSRMLPLLIHKLNIFTIESSKFIEYFYYLISAIFLSYIGNKIKNLYSMRISNIYLLLCFTFPLFITQMRSLAIPYFISISPFLFGLVDKKYKNSSHFIFIFTNLFLISFLNGVLSGYIVILSYLTGYFLVNRLKKTIIFLKRNISLLLISFGIATTLSQLIVIIQNTIFNDKTFINSTVFQINSLLKRYKKEVNFNENGVEIYSNVVDTCIETSVIDNIISYLNLKVVDVFIFEISLILLLLLIFISNAINKVFLKKDLLAQYVKFMTFSFLITMSWIALTNGHSACHLHFQSKLFLYSFLPVFYLYCGIFLDEFFKILKLKNTR